jgi:diguanylate cyclase (GGDEF)-like protein
VKSTVRTSGRRPLPADTQVKQRAATDDRATLRRDATIAERATARQDATIADLEQAAAETDQTLADADEAASDTDQAAADRDQRASDDDQATADRDHATHPNQSAVAESAYITSRNERATGTFERHWNRLMRGGTADARDVTATDRDRMASARDEAARARDARSMEEALVSTDARASLLKQLDDLRARAETYRARAAADRARAAKDRADAARERTRLEDELNAAHLDELTGAYRREMGRLALAHEIARARRSDGQFVLAFVDVDRLKLVNDRDGHAAGDHALQTVADAIRARLRSFDPIMRYGGDEFVCGLGGTDLADATRRFDLIGASIEADSDVGISVGFATLGPGDSADELIERADAAMLIVKTRHHARASRRSREMKPVMIGSKATGVRPHRPPAVGSAR